MIDINTRFITLIGTPLEQSFAARMQNRAYEAAGLNMRYFYTEAGSDHLKEIMDGIRYMPSFAGCAVTKPNKVRVLAYLDELDPLCEKMGACNTVVKQADGRMVGYNTDGLGFYRSITQEDNIDVANERFFCFGSGGAGRALCSILAYKGAQKLYITDIFEESGRALVDDINTNFAPVAEFVPAGDLEPMKDCGAILNATGVGMGQSVGSSPIEKRQMLEGRYYFDACYNPDRTQFLLDAAELGCRVQNGLGMSLYQGVAQIELWTGREAPVEAMRQELIDILREKDVEGNHAASGLFTK